MNTDVGIEGVELDIELDAAAVAVREEWHTNERPTGRYTSYASES